MASIGNNPSDNNLKRRNKNDEEGKTTMHQQNGPSDNDNTTMNKDSATLAWIWQYYFYYYYYYNHYMASLHSSNPNYINTNQPNSGSLNRNHLNNSNMNNATNFSSSTHVRYATRTPVLNQGYKF